MNIAELFVSLGISGSEKTAGALTGVRRGFQETAGMALETKAAIIAAMYAVERLFSASNKAGTGLQNFNATVGVSTKELQQYQYAAQQVGVSNEAVAGSFKNLQGTMTKILMGEGIPKGLARVALTVGDMEPTDIEKYAKEPQKLLQKLQEYAQKETNIGLRNEILKQFGLGDDMVAALSRNAFRPEILARAPTYSDAEIKKLDKNNAAWANLQQRIEMAFGRFNAKHGDEIIDGVEKITTVVIRLADALAQLAEKLEVFETFKSLLEGLEFLTQFSVSAADAFKSGAIDPKKAADANRKTDQFKADHDFVRGLSELLFGQGLFNFIFGQDKSDDRIKAVRDALKNAKGNFKSETPIIPQLRGGGVFDMSEVNRAIRTPGASESGSPAAGPQTQTINVIQTNNFNGSDGRDPARAAKAARTEVEKAFRQLPASQMGG